MSDYDDMRPSKRRCREISPVVDEDRYRIEQRKEKRHYDTGAGSSRSQRTRDEDYDRHRSRRRRSQSRDSRDYKDIEKRERRRRSDDSETEPSRSKYKDRSLSPRVDERKRRDKNKDRHRHRDRDRKRSRERESRRYKSRDRYRSSSPEPFKRSKGPLPSQNDAFTATATSNPDSALDKPVEKQKPNFGLTGKLAAASNTIQTGNQTIVLKYHEPPEARKPPARHAWRLYVFKDDEILDTVELSEQSCWLFGREIAVADFPIEHTSCSKQHAVIQFRYIEKRNEFGDKIGKVKPYVLDLESANGTMVNEGVIPTAQYVELMDKDVVKFGHSTREYVIQLPPSS